MCASRNRKETCGTRHGFRAKDGQKMDVSVPMKVVDALLSTTKQNELDMAAAVRALSDAGDELLVTVQGASEHVRIWIDSRNTAE